MTRSRRRALNYLVLALVILALWFALDRVGLRPISLLEAGLLAMTPWHWPPSANV